MITDIARKEVDLDTLKAGASLIPVAKITKVPKVVKAIGNVGKTGLKKGKEGDKTVWKRFTQEDKPKPDKNKGNQSKAGSKSGITTSKPNQEEALKSGQVKQTKARDKGKSGSKVDTVSGSGSGNIYKPSPKHDPRSGWGTPNPIPNNKVGQKLLDTAFSSNKNKQLYNYYEGQIIKFQPDGAGGWHSYAVLNIKNSIDFSVSFYNYHEPSIYPCL